MPFTAEQLGRHFAPVQGEATNPERHLAYYRRSLERLRNYESAGKSIDPNAVRRARQIEKDERFWVASALMALYHSTDRRGAFASLLAAANVAPPSTYPSWGDAFSGPLELFFEIGLNSPRAYRDHLRESLDERTPIPYVREQADRGILEGATQVDAMVLATETGAAALFEAKVLSDCSATVTYDVLRNQLARNVDVMLERQDRRPVPLSSRDPDVSAFVLLTPRLFKDHPRSRLYGWLLRDYRDNPGHLADDLPHRRADWESVAQRIGWATFEDCQEIEPTACPWIGRGP
jgi:hypothetical protein